MKKSFLTKFTFTGKVAGIYAEDLAKAMSNIINNDAVLNREYFVEAESLKIGDIFAIIYKKLYNEVIKQIRLPKCSFFSSKIHYILPISISNLFIDYLSAKVENFWKDFNVTEKTMVLKKAMDY